MKTPCRGRKECSAGCHAECAKYLVYWEECEKRRKERLKEANVRDYFGERKVRKARVFKKKITGAHKNDI